MHGLGLGTSRVREFHVGPAKEPRQSENEELVCTRRLSQLSRQWVEETSYTSMLLLASHKPTEYIFPGLHYLVLVDVAGQQFGNSTCTWRNLGRNYII